jgi:conjugative relaxase-like TrwC/TraI family protein
MFTCAKIRHGGTYLKNHLTANDYYCEGEHVVGRWMGEGSKLLGLNDQPIGGKDAAFEALRQNRMPDGGGRLTPRDDKDKNTVRFFDFQCSAQKSVSIMAVTLQDRRLYEAHDRAAVKAFAELERFAGFRTGGSNDRKTAISGNLCAAAFRHDASRALDPQIHTHFVVANATFDTDKKQWRALDTFEMFKAIRYAGKVYQNELALECRRLGYSIESVRNGRGIVEGFEISGVSKEVRKLYSKRRAEIEAGIVRFQKDKGREPTVKEISVITRETRNVKMREISTVEVRLRQREQLSLEEYAALDALKREAVENVSMGSAWSALKRAGEHIFERESVVHGHKVLSEALNRRLGYISLEKLHECFNRSKS